MTRKSCAVGMRNAILRNYLKFLENRNNIVESSSLKRSLGKVSGFSIFRTWPAILDLQSVTLNHGGRGMSWQEGIG